MKVTAAPAERAFWTARPRDGDAAGNSFAQMLEGGADARQVLGGRALGFAEAGIMGVHFALGTAAPPPAASRPAAEPLPDLPAQAAADSAATAPLSPPLAAEVIRADEARPLVAGQAAAAGKGAPQQAFATAPAQPLAVLAEAEACEAPVLAGRIADRLARIAANTTPLRIRLREENGGIAVFVDGIDADVTRTCNLDQIVRSIVSESGMTTSRVLVTPTRGTTNSKQKGN